MTCHFKVVEHAIPGQHIREYPNATRNRQEDTLFIAIKQYIPQIESQSSPASGLTIIGGHGAGFPKEAYEPLWAELCLRLQALNVPVRSIWMADSSNHGASGVLNEHVQGDSPSYFDHSRDLLHMINHFRDEMPRPIIGVAHSMGCIQLTQLSMMHPRLLSTLVLIDPVFLDQSLDVGGPPALLTIRRRDIWETREKAESSLRKALRSWDPRAIDKYLEYGLRKVPTALYDSKQNKDVAPSAVTLTTTKHQEAWMFAQINLEPKEAGLDRLLLPDWDPVIELPHISSRPECLITMQNLPFIRPSVLYVFGEKSHLAPTKEQDKKVSRTGVGKGGSGGAVEGKVEKSIVPQSSHLVVFERPNETASAAAKWIKRWHDCWLADEERMRQYGTKTSEDGMLRMSKAWIDAAKLPIDSSRPKGSRL